MSSSHLEAHLKSATARELEDWASLWSDLLHAEMILHTRAAIPAIPANHFARRALWEAAIVSYGRTAMSGRRRQQVEELLTFLGSPAKELHEDLMAWRNKHVAHRVDRTREQVDVRAMVDEAKRRVTGVKIRVRPVVGPEDQDNQQLASRVQEHVRVCKEAAWGQRIKPLEQRLLTESVALIDTIIAVAAQPDPPPVRGFSIDISPSGSPS